MLTLGTERGHVGPTDSFRAAGPVCKQRAVCLEVRRLRVTLAGLGCRRAGGTYGPGEENLIGARSRVSVASLCAGLLNGLNLPLVSLAEEEERAPCVRSGQQQ